MKVSIILTSYNYAQYLKDTINSILNQTFKDWELIVVDDFSTDNSVEIIMEFVNLDARIKLIRNWENQGLSKSVQTGLMAATGDWIAFLESDDLWREDYLENKLKVAESYPECGILYNNVEFFDTNAGMVEKKYAAIIKQNSRKSFPCSIFYDLGVNNLILTMSSVMIKRELFNEIDFNTPIDKLFDWYLYIQIAHKTGAYYVDEQLTLWRQHSESYIGRRGGIKFKLANINAYLQVYKREPWNFKLILFIFMATFLMCWKRLRVLLYES